MRRFFVLMCAAFFTEAAVSQISEVYLSSSSNALSVAGIRTQLWADPSLNEVMLIHRGDLNGNELSFDISKNAGNNWDLNRGPLYSSATYRPRYPQGVIFNPTGFADPDSAFVSFVAPMTDSAAWRGLVTGQQQVVTGSTPFAEADSVNLLNHYLPSGFTVTPQGIIWSVDAQFVNNVYNNMLIVTKGVWNSAARKFDYTNQLLSAPVVNTGGIARINGCNIAFAPDGLKGYVVMSGNNGTITDSVYYPIVFYTGDGGQSWSSSTNIGLVVDPVFGLGSLFYTMGPQFDIAVDANGSLHILCEILEGDNHWNGISTGGHFGIFDISSFNGAQWKAQLVVMPHTYMCEFGMQGNVVDPVIYEYNRPQISIDETGNKIFFTWIDTDTIIFGPGQNMFPDFHTRGYDLISNLWTADLNFTALTGTNADAQSYFNNVSYYCFTGTGDYTIPVTISLMQTPPISTGSPVSHIYLDGITIADAQFALTENPIILPGAVYGGHKYISGIVYFDENGNGVMDGTENVLSNQVITVQPEGVTLYTNTNGAYFFYTFYQSNVHTITTITPAGWMISSDSSSFTVADDTVNQSGFDFGINGLTSFNNMEVTVAGETARCGFPVTYWLTYENTGTTILDGQILFIIDSATSFISSVPNPDLISGDTLFYNFTNLYPFTSAQIVIELQMTMQAGDTVLFEALAAFDSTGTYYTLSDDPLQQVVSCSYDPNDKTVSPEGFLGNHYTLFTDTLAYTIRFQNTGNDTAFTVVLRDTLDPTLDLSTFHVTGSSHDVSTTIYQSRMAEFRFTNILLPDSGTDLQGSNGFVQYRIQPLTGITLPVTVTNTAYIYFDYNLPVQTNTVSNMLVNDIYVGVPRADYFPEDAVVVPNPFQDEAEIRLSAAFAGGQSHLRVMDALGKLVYAKTLQGASEKIYRGTLSPGVYFYEVRSNAGKRAVGKLVIN
jgi:uncharacterized repeat protein (TIGR01451 family)